MLKKFFAFLLFLFFYLYASVPAPQLNYQMDECSWDNNSNTYEVLNSAFTGNEYNATAINGANTLSGVINFGGDFDTKYMKLKTTYNLGTKWSASFWVKFPLDGSSNQITISNAKVYVIASVQGTGDLGFFTKQTTGFWFWSTTSYKFGVYDNQGNTKTVDIPTLSDGWHFFTITNNGNSTILYIDANTNNSYSVSLSTTGQLSLIGTSTDSSTDETIGAEMDEFKVWNTILSDNDIKTIYNNEKDGKNYDGTNRNPPKCSLGIEYRMDECSWDNDNNTYEIINNGSYGADYNASAGNYASIAQGKICNGADIVSNNSDDKYVIAKTDYSLPTAYSLNMWIKFPLDTDGHKNFSSSTGGNGWGWRGGGGGANYTLYYFNIADRTGSNNDFIYFAYNSQNSNAWSLNVDDDNGNDSYDFNPQNLSGWHMLTFVINNNGTDFYLDGSLQNNFSTHPNTNTLGLLFNSDYKSNNDDEPNGQSIGADVDEFEIYNLSLRDSQIQTIYNNEKNGKNYDGSSRTCPICNQTSINYKFDAWDIFRGGISDDDRNISTKIVNKNFELNISSLNENGDNYQEFNGTVCSAVIDENDNNISAWFKNSFNEDNTSTQTTQGNPIFNVSKAIKSAKIKIEWITNEDTTCPLSNETNDTNSTDNFAIRPLKFNISNYPTIAYAKEDFNISFEAKDNNDNNTTDYNETKGSSFDVIVKEIKNGCGTGNYNSNIKFANGGNTTIANYDETGEIDINITDKNIACSDRFAQVDCKDKNISGYWNSNIDTSIKESNITLKVLPYDINLSYNITNLAWIYMDRNLSTNNIELNITATAYAKNSSTALQDYNSTCYAKDINISFGMTITNPDEFNGTYHINKGKSTYSNDINFTDTNFTALKEYNWTIPKTEFANGKGTLSIKYNIDKNYSIPVSIVDTNLASANIATPNLSKYENNISIDKNTSYYYAKLYTKDIFTTNTNSSELIPILVYDTTNKHFNNQILLNWYHQTNNDKNITQVLGTSTDYVYDSDKNVSNFDASIDFAQPDFNLSLQNNSDNNIFVVIHLKTPKYLWYSKYSDYNDTNQSSCVGHYCIEYTYKPNISGNEVGSGTFVGSEINTTQESNQTIKGVKIYR